MLEDSLDALVRDRKLLLSSLTIVTQLDAAIIVF